MCKVQYGQMRDKVEKKTTLMSLKSQIRQVTVWSSSFQRNHGRRQHEVSGSRSAFKASMGMTVSALNHCYKRLAATLKKNLDLDK